MADLTEFAWFVRDMPAAASSVLLGRTRLYAGDWDGNLIAWSADGTLLWQDEAEDRIERMCGASDATPPFVCATAGSQVTCHDAATGDVRWANQLTGSADLVACLKDGERVLATSSVYEIELNDFIESTCWRFDSAGAEVRSDTFEERPWHLLMDECGTATMGLGRPRCGIIRQTDSDSEHFSLAPDDPILCGSTKGGRTLFGHASGSLSELDGDNLKTIIRGEGESVQVLDSDGESALFGGDDGVLRAMTPEGEWTSDLTDPLDLAILGFWTAEGPTYWVAQWNGLRARLSVMGSGGRMLATFGELPRILSLSCRGERVAVGLEDGRVFLIREELFTRRLDSRGESQETHAHSDEDEGEENPLATERDDPLLSTGGATPSRLSMQERLRALRRKG